MGIQQCQNQDRCQIEGSVRDGQSVMEQPLSPLSYLFDLINYASLIILNKLSILFHPIIVWPCRQYYKVQGWAHV